jgi:AraC-like DNA-binding protein/ligand-binding sensor protein
MATYQAVNDGGHNPSSLTESAIGVGAKAMNSPHARSKAQVQLGLEQEIPAPLENGRNLIDVLAGSKLYREYEKAFSEAVGVPLTLRAVESWQLPYHGKRVENQFCAFLAAKSRSCAACLRTTQRLSRLAADQPASVTCASGLCETAVPVRVGERLIGFLQTGQIFSKPPTEAQFERTAKLLQQWDVAVRKDHLHDAFFQTRVLTPAQHQSMITMLTIFGQHLSMVGEQIAVWKVHAEPPVIARARSYIFEHQSEDLSLGQVAKAVNASSFYFCKLFKKSTGINFIDYLSQLRIDKAKNLLLNPNCLVSEIAFEVGFQSLTHFNRVFKKMTGVSPSQYRAQLPTQ